MQGCHKPSICLKKKKEKKKAMSEAQKMKCDICMYKGLLVITILPFVTTWIELVKLVRQRKTNTI